MYIALFAGNKVNNYYNCVVYVLLAGSSPLKKYGGSFLGMCMRSVSP